MPLSAKNHTKKRTTKILSSSVRPPRIPQKPIIVEKDLFSFLSIHHVASGSPPPPLGWVNDYRSNQDYTQYVGGKKLSFLREFGWGDILKLWVQNFASVWAHIFIPVTDNFSVNILQHFKWFNLGFALWFRGISLKLYLQLAHPHHHRIFFFMNIDIIETRF